MDIGIVGGGPAAEAFEAAMEDVDARVVKTSLARLDEFDVGFVVETTGAAAFTDAASAVDRWVAVEVGGLGGVPLADVDAAVSVFTADSGCYRCLGTRVEANVENPAEKPTGVKSAVRFAGAVAGRRTIRLLSGEDVGGTTVEVPGAERRFDPVPSCVCDPGQDGTLTLYHEAVDLPTALSNAERAVDDRVGLVRQVGEQESFPLPYYVAQTADTTGFSDARAAEFGGGADADWNRAYMKALGEVLERYAAGVYRTDAFRRSTAADLDGAVPAARFVVPEGFGDADADAERLWTPAMDLRTGTGAWLPAELVQYPPPEERIRPAITTGLGLGNSTVEAVLSGLYEVIERDATMLGWYSTFDPLGLRVDDERVAELEKRARAEGLSVSTSLVTQDVDVPVVAAAVHREDDDWPRFAMGSGCDLDPAAAARSAVAEALQNWVELRGMGREAAAAESGAIGEYADFPEAGHEFTRFEATVDAAAVVDEETATLGGETELSAAVDRVADAGLDAYAARVTPRDVESLGFEAVRVTVPEAQPLFTGEPFFGSRLHRVAESMGFEPRPDREYHPFP